MKHPCDKKTASSSEDSSFTVQQAGLMAVMFLALALTLQAQPSWWTTTGGPVNPSGATNDYRVANQGQLKQFTQKAVQYLDTNLAGGAGTNLTGMISGWSNYYATNGYSSTNPAPTDMKAINQGQLKYIVHQVFPVLATNGYMTTNYPVWAQTNSSDFKAANVGQLKKIFSFEIAAPQAPQYLTTVVGSTNATFTWTDPVLNVQAYLLQDSTDGGTTWTTISTLDGSTNAATVNGLLLGTNYLFRVSATNMAGSSAPSTNAAAPVITLSTPSGAVLVP